MATNAVAREAVCALRREIARIEGRLPERFESPVTAPAQKDEMLLRRSGLPSSAQTLTTGAASLDAALGGGLPLGALTEIHGRQTRDAGAVAGFTLALCARTRKADSRESPLLWITCSEVIAEAGRPYAPGLIHRFGFSASSILLADIHRLEDALWVAEEAASLSGFSAVILEIRGHSRKLDLTATRRLHRRAQNAARPFFLLRQAGLPEPTAAPVRLIVSPAPAGERRVLSRFLTGSIGPPAFLTEIGRSRSAIPAKAVLEWNRNECAFHERTDPADGTQDFGAVAALSGERPHFAHPAGAQLALRKIA